MRIRTEVPQLTSLTPYHRAKPVHLLIRTQEAESSTASCSPTVAFFQLSTCSDTPPLPINETGQKVNITEVVESLLIL